MELLRVVESKTITTGTVKCYLMQRFIRLVH